MDNSNTNMMQKFNELALKYKNYSKKINTKNKNKNVNKKPNKNILQTMSNIVLKIKNYEKIISELKNENDVYNDFNKLCNEFIDINRKRNILIDKIQKSLVLSTLNIEPTKLDNEDKTLLFVQDALFKSNEKFYNNDNKIAKRQEKINNFKKLINVCIEDKYKDISLCQNCLKNKINNCLNPCGHTFCNECSTKMQNCPNCKSSIYSKIKICFNNDNDNTNTAIDGHNGSTLSISLIDKIDDFYLKKECSSYDPLSSIGFSNF